MENKSLQITILSPSDAQRALDFLALSGEPYTPDEGEHLKSALNDGAWAFIMASIAGTDIGCAYVNRRPKYRAYTLMNMPEMQDLRVLPAWRKQGIGRMIVQKSEEIAKSYGASGLGLSVGLTADFGPAQRLYAQMGYMPDGFGLTYDREYLEKNARITLDDDLCLMLLKHF